MVFCRLFPFNLLLEWIYKLTLSRWRLFQTCKTTPFAISWWWRYRWSWYLWSYKLYSKDYHSYDGRVFRDSGVIGGLWFDIIDGKKVFKKFAGVNQPMELIWIRGLQRIYNTV